MSKKIIGNIGVDAGLCWIGDPCYVLPDDADQRYKVRDWSKFYTEMKGRRHKSFSYKIASEPSINREGLGVCVRTGYGDGEYPVEATFNKDGRVASVTVTFIEKEE